jgi:tRNA(fMet)-specific endonuclease VapC
VARYLLDTNICIYIRQKRPKVALARFLTLPPGEAALSVITFGELAVGVEKSADPVASLKGLQELASVIPILPLPATAGIVYGKLRAELERKGQTIGNNDFWIAAHAIASGLTLVTNNAREFRRVPGLTIENWAE